ncbi:MAG TPA: DUF1571 domain-containing protein [Gemmataceae bacterium]|nr:DUF1571 domain-containing protein [Gemmataceae bacterium]
MFFNLRPKRRRSRARSHSGGLFGWLRPASLVGLLALTGGSGSVLHLPQLSTASAQQQQPQVQQPQFQLPPYQQPQPQLPQGQPQYQQPQQQFQQPPQQFQQKQPVQPAGAAAPAPKEWPLDQPLNLIRQAQASYGMVNSYQCVLIAQERVSGKLLPENVMQLSFRKNPFSVYMKWIAPQDKVGQEVLFVYGQNQNRMQVMAAGFAKSFGWMNKEVNDPLVMQHSRHKITETGMGNLIERCTKCWEAERLQGLTEVRLNEYEYNKRRCVRIETWHTQKHPNFYCWRNVVYLDSESHLPVRMECYDWPQGNGPQGGELLECFSYIDVNFNQVQDNIFTVRK